MGETGRGGKVWEVYRKLRVCPSDGCGVQVATFSALRMHVRNRHPRVTLVMRGGRMVKCKQCGIFVPGWRVTGSHTASQQCRMGREQRSRQLEWREQKCRRETTLTIGGERMENVWTFNYLGWKMREDNDDWGSALRNIMKA